MQVTELCLLAKALRATSITPESPAKARQIAPCFTGLTPRPSAIPGPTEHHPGHPDDRSGDTGYPAVGHRHFKINYRIPRSTGGYAVDLG